MQYKIMGSVKRVRMKPGCVPSRFDGQETKKRKPSPALDMPEDVYEEVEVQPTVCPIELSSSLQKGNI